VNCAALPLSIAESELFGHMAGSFTGAVRDRAGKFEIADGGTLFLDEVGEMPLSLQAKLLRVLQEGEFTTVGGRQPIKANVRIVAATHRDLRQLIRQGLFREDLFYRLNVVPIRLPPLRERMEDIPLLARHFLDRARLAGLPSKQLSAEAMDALKGHAWPGNARELENLMRRLAALYPQEVIGADAVAAELAEAVQPAGPDGQSMPATLEQAVERHLASFMAAHKDGMPVRDLYERVLAEVERPLLRLALGATRGNQIKAAAMLGLNRNTLRKKIRELELPVVRGLS
jgi:two-component system nitrogen regulation response regulator GlnG